MLKQFGKPSSALLMQKHSFFEENALHVEKQREIAKLYTAQSLRKHCKNCAQELHVEADFIKDSIPYKICQTCTHLNGAHEDTQEFCEKIYQQDDTSYAQNYSSGTIEDYEYRTASIYFPKAEFLFTCLKRENVNPHKLSYFDYGAGSGYFVAALLKLGLANVTGSDVSVAQVNLANRMFTSARLTCHSIDDGHKGLEETKAEVVSMIGVLEHLQTPREALAKINANPNIKYVFLSVPTFSLSVYIEMLDDNIFHRQLHGGHTHLYTEKSIDYLCTEFELEIVGRWWFGTDMVDLYRQIYVKLEQKHVSETIKNDFKDRLSKFLDQSQLELDKVGESSEVHILLRKKNA